MNTVIKRHTLSVLVENSAGVLSQVSRLFSRKGYNIESLAVGTTDDPAVSRITIEVLCGEQQVGQIINLIKVRAESREVRNEVIQIANIFRASIIDVSTQSLTLAIIGQESKDDALEKLLAEFGILELVRTGMVALERGEATIRNNSGNKVRDEFDLGKNIL